MTDAELLTAINLDRVLGSAVLFGHRHPDESPPAHAEIIQCWSCSDEFVCIEASREFGKTTLGEECVTMAGCFGNFRYLLLIGETYQKACDRLSAINTECVRNEFLQRLFWPLYRGPVLKRKSVEDRLWFSSGAYIQALGWDQELQSFKHNEARPDWAYLDDPENQERVRDKGAVDQSMRKLFLELIPAMDVKRRRVRLSETRRAEDCMVTRCAANPEWLYRGFPVCNGDPADPATASNFPARYPMTWVRSEQAKFQKAGMLREFNQVYLLIATDTASKPFRAEQLKALDVAPWKWLPRFVVYDPSRTTNAIPNRKGDKSDRTGKVVVSRLGSQILVHESAGEYWKPDAFIADVFATNAKHRPVELGVEKNSLDDWILQPLRIESLRRGEILPLRPLLAPQDRSKDDFIMGLQPFIEAGDVVLIGGRSAHPQLCAEIENFPQGPRDTLNALAYSLRMFAGTPMYEDFGPDNVREGWTPSRGESVWIAFNGTPTECVAVAVARQGRRLAVLGDWSAAGALSEAVKTVCFGVRATFPLARLQVFLPAETYDQWQRVALLPALRAEKFTPMRAEHVGVARGGLAQRLRTTWHNQRLLTVAPTAIATLNALSAGYALQSDPGKPLPKEPKMGPARLLAEALETMVATLDRQGEEGAYPPGANMAVTPRGVPFVTANPRA